MPMENITNKVETAGWLFCVALFLALPMHLRAQAVTVSGTVSDETGQTLPGVNVLIKGTTNGATTDSDGNYTIQADGDDNLTFSFVGFQTLEVPVGNRTRIDVT